MKRFFAISFILLQLFTTTEMGELFKLPVLIQHYFEHDEKDDHLPFLDFLKEHYAEMHAIANKTHADHHKRLPFKTVDCGFFATIAATVPSSYFANELIVTDCPTINNVKSNSSTYSHFLANIWQPPRLNYIA